LSLSKKLKPLAYFTFIATQKAIDSKTAHI
jgi:hypothetical protein